MKEQMKPKKIGMWLLSAALFAAACSEEEPVREAPSVVADRQTVTLNKLGWTPLGEQGLVEVESNVYWQMALQQQGEWLAADRMGGFGKTAIALTASPNEGTERRATLVLETYEGVQERIEVVQRAGDERLDFFRLDLDGEAAREVPVESFGAFAVSGTGSYRTRIAGERASVDGESPSAGYDGASGGNNLLLGEESAEVRVESVDLKWQQDFTLSFASMSDGPAFLADEFALSVSRDGDNWLDVPFEREQTPGWCRTDLNIRFKQKTQFLYLRWKSLSTSARFRIDDIALAENPDGGGVELDFDNLYDDNRPEGWLYYEERFDWITPDFAQPKAAPLVDFIGIFQAEGRIASTGPRYDRTGSDQGVYPWTVTDFWQPSGWAHQTKNAIYLCDGYFQMGSAGGEADIVSPRLNRYKPENPALSERAGIPIGKRVNLRVSFDASTFVSATGVEDNAVLRIEVLDQGTVGSRDPGSKSVVVEVDSYNAWKNYAVTVFDASAETRLKFSVEKGARHHFDNLRIEKTYNLEE